jgi:hypothetical protein
MDGLDLESLLGNGFPSASTADGGFEDFLGGVPSNDPGAIFVPVDSGVSIPGTEWGDSLGSTTSPNGGIQQWVSNSRAATLTSIFDAKIEQENWNFQPQT